MEDLKIFAGVEKQDKQYLFDAKIEKELHEIKTERDRLDKEIQKYDQIKAILERLPHELGWPIPFLPVTSHAFFPGATLTNTNEVQVHIGDGWFTRCSAHHAIGICNRRQEKCEETKQLLGDREQLLLPWLRVAQGKEGIAGGREREAAEDEEDEDVGPADAFTANEIEEFITEEEYKSEKELHETRVRAHYLKQREQQRKMEESSNTELWARLEELELEEASSSELKCSGSSENLRPGNNKMGEETPRYSVHWQSETECASDQQRTTKKQADRLDSGRSKTCKSRAASKIQFGETADISSMNPGEDETSEEQNERLQASKPVTLGWSWDDGDEESANSESSDSETTINSKETPESKERPVKLLFAEHIETGSDETSVIEFAHTPVEPLPSPRVPGILESPSDIYTNYQEQFGAAEITPKSILKRRSVEESSENWPAVSYPTLYDSDHSGSETTQPSEDAQQSSPQQQVLMDITEKKQALAPSKPEASSKKNKMSKFKSSRMASKRSK